MSAKRGPVPETRVLETSARRSSKATSETVTLPESVGDLSVGGTSNRGLILGLAGAAIVALLSVIWFATRPPQSASPQEPPPVEEPAALAPEPEPQPAAVVEPPPPEPEPRPVVAEPVVAPPPAVEPVVETPKVAPKPKVDALASRYRRVQGAWSKARRTRSAEDQRIFDVMLSEVGKQLDKGSRADAAEALNDFVAGALNGKEP